MESNDVFADEVPVHRPALGELLVVGAVAMGSDVVGECIKPHVGHVLVVPRQGNAPFKGLAAHRKVVEPTFDEPDYFVAAKVGRDCIGVFVIPVE